MFELQPGLFQSSLIRASDVPAILTSNVSVIIDMDSLTDEKMLEPFVKVYHRWHIQDLPELPNLDDLWTTAEFGFKSWRLGNGVLSQCIAGKNRSSLVAGCILNLYGISGPDAVEMIREKNPEALSNEVYLSYLLSLKR